MLSTRHGVRVLGTADLADFLRLAARDPVVNVFADYRARTTNLEPRWLGGEMWGRFADGELTAACHVGANLVPVQATEDDARVFAERALTRGRTRLHDRRPADRGAHLLGRRRRHLGPPARAALGPAAPGDRRAARRSSPTRGCGARTIDDLGRGLPGLRRDVHRGGRRLARSTAAARSSTAPGSASSISRGWSFARFEDGRLVFKAEVACASPYAAQVQGVWVPPDRRGEGIAVRGMAAVVELVRPTSRRSSRSTSTSTTARPAAYERVGFRQTATFATIMF